MRAGPIIGETLPTYDDELELCIVNGNKRD